MDQRLLTVALVILFVGQLRASCNDCGLNTQCSQGNCVCEPGLVGNPLFQCYDPNSLYCKLNNDIGLHTFGDESIVVHTLGSARIAHLLTDRISEGRCDLKLGAWTERVEGKIYIKGVEFMLKQMYNGGVQDSVKYRVTGNVGLTGSGAYSYNIERRQASESNFNNRDVLFSGDTQYNEDRDCNLKFKYTQGKFIEISLTCCQITFGFRPFNPLRPNRIPGMFVEVSSSANANFSNWWVSEEPLCLGGNYRISNVSADCGLPDPREAMAYLSLTNQGPLGYPNAPAGEQSSSVVFRACSVVNRQRFFDFASFELDNPVAIRCVSDNPGQGDIFRILRLTLKWLCLNLIPECLMAKSKITNALTSSSDPRCNDLSTEFPQINDYVTMSCVP